MSQIKIRVLAYSGGFREVEVPDDVPLRQISPSYIVMQMGYPPSTLHGKPYTWRFWTVPEHDELSPG